MVDLPPEYDSTLAHLVRTTQRWAVGKGFDADAARTLRHRLLLLNHDHYRTTIPAYEKLCAEEEIGALTSITPITERLMSTDDLFKSYNAKWLDENRYDKMTEWVGHIHHRRISVDTVDVTSVDTWIDRLATAELVVAYSSGTSGKFSFIPRDEGHLERQRQVTAAYLVPWLYSKVGSGWQKPILSWAAQHVKLSDWGRVTAIVRPRDYDALFLDFRHGRTGMQTLGHQVAGLFRSTYYLYEGGLTATALRSLTRGVTTPEEQAVVDALRAETVARQTENFDRTIENLRRSTADGQKLFIFGAPFQLKSISEYLQQIGKTIALKAGSFVFFGGGWKAFSGEQITREALVSLVSEAFGIPPQNIIEGYSMVELNVMNLRCDHGRFHMPPIVEPLLFDEELMPMDSTTGRGIFGFLDPLATAYPGFLITGDMVRMVDDSCPCGLVGPAITEIGRAANREARGCAGVMAAVRA